jgi:hypothetical protein
MTEDQTDRLIDALEYLGNTIHDATTSEAVDGSHSMTEAIDSIAAAIGRHADAMERVARALDMDCLSHALCMGIRKGLFGASADSDVSIERVFEREEST